MEWSVSSFVLELSAMGKTIKKLPDFLIPGDWLPTEF